MEKFIMKKQIIAAAVAATVSAVAMADISLTGSAKYEYLYEDTSAGVTTNKSNTEMKLAVKGKQGDTGVFIGIELDASDASDNATGNTTDIEDMYLTTKVGDVNVKAGNWASGTTALLGEIDNGPRAHNKVDLSTTVGGIKLYAGNSGTQGSGAGRLNENMYGGATFELAGNTVQLKRVSETTKGYGLAGSLSGFDYRIEHKSKDGVNQGVTFGQVSTKVGDMGVSYAMIDAESGNLVDENDSSIFAVEMGHSTVTGTTDDAQQQVTVTSSVDGNALTFKMGTIENAFSAGADMDYTQIMASRPLASGATATLTWTEQDTSATASKETFEIDLSVSF
jgi:hypothetical protein